MDGLYNKPIITLCKRYGMNITSVRYRSVKAQIKDGLIDGVYQNISAWFHAKVKCTLPYKMKRAGKNIKMN